MKPSQNRLGRGLGALIAGGTPPPAAPAPSPTLSKKNSTEKSKGSSTAKTSVTKSPAATKALPEVKAVEKLPEYREILIEKIDSNPHQPRQHMDPEKLDQLVASIRSEGLLQPIVVREAGERFELIAGERRLQACQSVGMRQIPCRILNVTDASSATLALIENLQREGLNPIEEAMGFKSLMDDFDLTQEAVAERLGKSRPVIANALRFLQLPQEIRGYLAKGLISPGHAKVILSLADSALQLVLARRIMEEQMSVRQAEKALELLQKNQLSSRASPIYEPMVKDLALQDLERRAGLFLGARVFVKHTAKKGRIVIEYKGEEQLQNILELTGLTKA